MVKILVEKQTILHVFIDQQLLNEYFDFLALPDNHRFGFAEQKCISPKCLKSKGEHMHMRLTRPETAYSLRMPIYRRVNVVESPLKRGSTTDVRVIQNITFDIDWRPDPDIALEVGLIFRQKISDELSTHPDIPIILSGRGIHIVINIPSINVGEDEGELMNQSIANVVKQYFLPHFEYAKSIIEAQTLLDLKDMKLEGYDIARLMSAPGDISPHTGEIRSVYQNDPLIRRESKPVQKYILYEFVAIQTKILEFRNFTEEFTLEEEILYKEAFKAQMHDNDIFQAVTATLKWYIEEKEKNGELTKRSDGEIDRSALFGKLVWYIANRCQSGNAPYHFRHIIHAYCHNRYETEEQLTIEIDRSIRRWPGPVAATYEERKEYVKETRKDIRSRKIVKEESDEMLLLKFFNKFCERGESYTVEKRIFLQKYHKFCSNINRLPLTEKRITRQLTQLNISSKRKKVKGVYIRIYAGIKFKFT